MSMILGLYNYWIVIVLMMIGFYIIIAHGHLIKKIVGLNIFQTSVFIFYISLGKVEGGKKNQLDIMHLYNIQHKIELLQQVIMKLLYNHFIQMLNQFLLGVEKMMKLLYMVLLKLLSKQRQVLH